MKIKNNFINLIKHLTVCYKNNHDNKQKYSCYPKVHFPDIEELEGATPLCQRNRSSMKNSILKITIYLLTKH